MLEISFDSGTLLVKGDDAELEPIKSFLKFDNRVQMYRSEAYNYAPIIRLIHGKIDYKDFARGYQPLDLNWQTDKTPRPHQAEAFEAWKNANCRGVVILPTGSGKSFLAQMAIQHVQRPTLVVVPTIDLLNQWVSQLEEAFKMPIGMVGGGSKEIAGVTVSTYDSALLMMEFRENAIDLLI